MTDIRSIGSYVSDLFRYLDAWESGRPDFHAEAFLQTYNGIYAVFQALRQQQDKALQVDQIFLEKVRQTPMERSDLRLLTVQILISFFEQEADIHDQANQAYSYCRELRPIKQDARYFESYLVPALFGPNSLRNDHRLNVFLLGEIARFLRKHGTPLEANLSPESFAALSVPAQFLHLIRRRLELGEDLLGDRMSLEHHLARVKVFARLKNHSRLCEHYLRTWGYITTGSFWRRLAGHLGTLGEKFKGAILSWRYLRLVLTQRAPAYFFYAVIIVALLAGAVWVPMKWTDYANSRLEEFEQHADSLDRLSQAIP